jgi:hypothetical protein
MKPGEPRRRTLYAIRTGIFAPMLVIATIWTHPWPRHGLDRVHHAVDWPHGCEEISTLGEITLSWPHARQVATITCEFAGPGIAYARFASQADLREDLTNEPPWGATCISGREVVVDALDPGQFDDVCRRLHGHDIDGVAGIPAPPDDSEPAMATHDLRVRVSEGLALRDYWSGD